MSITLYTVNTSSRTTIAFDSHSLGGDTDKSNTAWVRTMSIRNDLETSSKTKVLEEPGIIYDYQADIHGTGNRSEVVFLTA